MAEADVKTWIGILGSCVVWSAAALAQPAGGPPFPPPPDGPGGGDQLFISPFGEPFRAKPGDPYPVAAWFSAADANHDGALDPAEFRADAARFFLALDRNQDGVIDGSEITFYESRLVPEILAGERFGDNSRAARLALVQFGGGSMGGSGGGMGGPGGGMGGPGGGMGGGPGGGPPPPGGGSPRMGPPRPRGAAPYGLLGEPEPVTSADENFNGRITRIEFEHAADRKFRLLDSDDDGRVTLKELPLTAVQRMTVRPPRGRAPRPGM